MGYKNSWKARDVVKSNDTGRHLEQLERELKKSGCKRLETHIRQLKVAWGRACDVPGPTNRAA